MSRLAKAPGGPLRRMARLLMRPNDLRRPTDRVEAVIVGLLAAAFLAAVAVAPGLAARIYQWESARAASLQPAVAVLSQRGPAGSYGAGETAARWRAPDGQWRSGMLTTETAPSIVGAPAAARVRVWLTGSGTPADPPDSQASEVFAAVTLAVYVACGAAVVLAACYWISRVVLGRRRLAAWETDWALTAPWWTIRPR